MSYTKVQEKAVRVPDHTYTLCIKLLNSGAVIESFQAIVAATSQV